MLKCQVIDKIGSTYTLKCLYDNEDEDDFEASMCATFTVGKPGQSSSKKRKASSSTAPAPAHGAAGKGGADDTVGEEEGGDSDEEGEEYRDLSDDEEGYGGRPEHQMTTFGLFSLSLVWLPLHWCWYDKAHSTPTQGQSGNGGASFGA